MSTLRHIALVFCALLCTMLAVAQPAALVEANRAQFHIRPGPHAGTLVEVVFSRTPARA